MGFCMRLIQRTAYGYRDEEYLRLKIIASFLPPLRKCQTEPTLIREEPQENGALRQHALNSVFSGAGQADFGQAIVWRMRIARHQAIPVRHLDLAGGRTRVNPDLQGQVFLRADAFAVDQEEQVPARAAMPVKRSNPLVETWQTRARRAGTVECHDCKLRLSLPDVILLVSLPVVDCCFSFGLARFGGTPVGWCALTKLERARVFPAHVILPAAIPV